MTANAEATPESTSESVAESAASEPVTEDVMPAGESEDGSAVDADAEIDTPPADTDVESGKSVSEPEASEPEIEAREPETTEPEVSEPEVDASVIADVKPAASNEPWGKVDDDGTVSVREAAGWRVVGQYPDGSAEEALAYFERKYSDLASEVGLLEVRHHRGGASASDIRSAARIVEGKLNGAAAVGDLASLEARVAKLSQALSAATATEAAASREAVEAAVRERTELVEKAEALAARDPKSVQWKQASADLSAMFDQWQAHQQNGPRLPKAAGQQLWKRFRDARAIVDKNRRDFYAQLDDAHKSVRDRKTKLVEKAEALAPKGEDGIGAYRDLLDEWKGAGRAGKKADDALWARFKAAGDALYGARIEREAADVEASREKIDAKRELLVEARTVADESDIAKARALLTSVQRRWDDIGRVFPRDVERGLDDDLRKIEQALRTREESDWKRNNPETKARANDMTRQLTEAIGKLEDELTAAKASGDTRAITEATEALAARRAWLTALGG